MLDLLFWVGWNIYLALIPVGLAQAIVALLQRPGRRERPWRLGVVALLGLVWFLFLPNTCYLLTEWRHFFSTLDDQRFYSQWVAGDRDALVALIEHTLFYAAFSGVGLLTFVLAIRPIVRALRPRFPRLWMLGAPFFVAMALGVYLGLVLRFNSWDVLHNLQGIWAASLRAIARPELAAALLLFGGALWVVYVVVDIWVDGLGLRWEALRRGRGDAADMRDPAEP